MGEENGQRSSRFQVEHVSKRFGATRALSDVTVKVMPGELVGLAGHNGAGKSTLLRSMAGLVRPDEGLMRVGDITVPLANGLSAKHSRGMGIRSVHQELSLCPGLRVDESAAVVLRAVRGFGWRQRAWRLLSKMLDEIFPGNGIEGNQRISDLSIARRQMVEVASATLTGGGEIALLILDEPTSSLDADATASLYRWLRVRAGEGLSAIVTTHRLNEMLSFLDRVYVMRDGRVIAEEQTSDLSRQRLVNLMGGTTALEDSNEQSGASEVTVAREGIQTARPVKVEINGLTTPRLHNISIEASAGDIVGLAGLEGHGQQAVLDAVFRAPQGKRFTRNRAVRVHGKVAYVSGDRAVAGIFRFWSVRENISLSSLRQLSRAGWLSRRAERLLVSEWGRKLDIRGFLGAPIVSLSGGNQQKALIARAVATSADVILLDDPTRGVDQGTKEQMYAIVRDEAAAGRCFIWYSTENEELIRFDQVYVLKSGRIAEVLKGEDRLESRIIDASFKVVEDA